jgi:hypothetical protein
MPTRVIAGSRTAHGACPSCRLIAPVSPQYPGSGSRASHDRQPEHPERCLTGDGRRTARACAERQAATGRGAAGSSATRQSREPPCGRGHTPGPIVHPAGRKRTPGDRRGTPTSRDRRLAVVVFRRPEGRRGRVQLDNPGNRPAGSATPPGFVHPAGRKRSRRPLRNTDSPGIDDLQSSSSAGPRGGRVECNSTIPGTALRARPHPPVLFIRTASSNRQPIEELRIEPETS